MTTRKYRNRNDLLVVSDSIFDSTAVWLEIIDRNGQAACMYLDPRQQRALVNAIEQKLKEKQP